MQIAQVKNFKIVKKNRKYFEAMTGGYKCKIVIDAASDSLEVGTEQALKVNDLSVRSKYGVDLIFILADTPKPDAGVCSLRHDRYNLILIERCRALGGRWDGSAKAWIFSGIVETEVDALDDLFNGEKRVYDVLFKEDECAGKDSIRLFGYTVAKAEGRDSGAKIGDGVALIEGRFGSGGSVKNWTTTVSAGTKIRLEMPVALLGKYTTKENRVITEVVKAAA